VTGTALVKHDSNIYACGDGYGQAIRCFEIIREALEGIDAAVTDVTHTRMFVTEIELWEE